MSGKSRRKTAPPEPMSGLAAVLKVCEAVAEHCGLFLSNFGFERPTLSFFGNMGL